MSGFSDILGMSFNVQQNHSLQCLNIELFIANMGQATAPPLEGDVGLKRMNMYKVKCPAPLLATITLTALGGTAGGGQTPPHLPPCHPSARQPNASSSLLNLSTKTQVSPWKVEMRLPNKTVS